MIGDETFSDDFYLMLQKDALRYLDLTHSLTEIRDKSVFYSQIQDKIYEFVIRVNSLDLSELNAELGNLTLNHPDKASRLFQEVVYSAVTSLSLLPSCQAMSQVAVRLKLTALPNHPEYRLESAGDIVKHKTFVQYNGIIMSMSSPHKYTMLQKNISSEGLLWLGSSNVLKMDARHTHIDADISI